MTQTKQERQNQCLEKIIREIVIHQPKSIEIRNLISDIQKKMIILENGNLR